MKGLFALATAATLIASPAFAKTCEEMALSKDGKPLHGAAKDAFVKKCEKDKGGAPAAAAPGGCAAKALSKDGKPLHGAAKDGFIKKCEADAKAG